MFNLASKIRHCCPLYGCVPLIFEWRGRYMFFCTHLEAPMPTRGRKRGISGAGWLRTFGKGTGNDLDHTKFWKAVAENRSENAVAALETMIEETE